MSTEERTIPLDPLQIITKVDPFRFKGSSGCHPLKVLDVRRGLGWNDYGAGRGGYIREGMAGCSLRPGRVTRQVDNPETASIGANRKRICELGWRCGMSRIGDVKRSVVVL